MLRHIRLAYTRTTHTQTRMRTREVLQDSRALKLLFEALRVRSRCTTLCSRLSCAQAYTAQTCMQCMSGSSVHSSECLHSVYACLRQCVCVSRTYDHVYTLLFFSNHNLIACIYNKACTTQRQKRVLCLFLVTVCAVHKVCHSKKLFVYGVWCAERAYTVCAYTAYV